jgi:hypothetical protein
MANARPVNPIVGLPAIPSPFVMAKPFPVTTIDRLVTVVPPVLTIMPFAADSRLPEAPFRTT